MREDEVKKELKEIKPNLPNGIDVMINDGYLFIYKKNKKKARIKFTEDSLLIKTDMEVIKV